MGKAKSKKGRLPKKIAGVKLPKEARRQVERVIEELKQPIVREMIAGAVGMAATALARQAADWKTTKPLATSRAEAKPEPASRAEPPAKSGGEQFAEIATGLAVAGLGKFLEKMQANGDQAKKSNSPKG